MLVDGRVVFGRIKKGRDILVWLSVATFAMIIQINISSIGLEPQILHAVRLLHPLRSSLYSHLHLLHTGNSYDFKY
jgi:hypothetical protein